MWYDESCERCTIEFFQDVDENCKYPCISYDYDEWFVRTENCGEFEVDEFMDISKVIFGIRHKADKYKPNFIHDMCKVADMFRCGKDEFLRFYSNENITEQEWNNTYKLIMLYMQESHYFPVWSVKEYEQIEKENEV